MRGLVGVAQRGELCVLEFKPIAHFVPPKICF